MQRRREKRRFEYYTAISERNWDLKCIFEQTILKVEGPFQPQTLLVLAAESVRRQQFIAASVKALYKVEKQASSIREYKNMMITISGKSADQIKDEVFALFNRQTCEAERQSSGQL